MVMVASWLLCRWSSGHARGQTEGQKAIGRHVSPLCNSRLWHMVALTLWGEEGVGETLIVGLSPADRA
jgi:hypothetical protein